MSQRACDCKSDEEMNYLIFSFLGCGIEAKRVEPPQTPQKKKHLEKLAESGERSVLALGSLSLPCSMRDTP